MLLQISRQIGDNLVAVQTLAVFIADNDTVAVTVHSDSHIKAVIDDVFGKVFRVL